MCKLAAEWKAPMTRFQTACAGPMPLKMVLAQRRTLAGLRTPLRGGGSCVVSRGKYAQILKSD